MQQQKGFPIIGGFLLLFAVYHFPEFFSDFWLMAVFKLGFLVVAFGLARAQGFRGLSGYGLPGKWHFGKHLAGGLILGLCGFLSAIFLSGATLPETPLKPETISAVMGQLPLILLMTAVPSLAEDLLTRGYLFANFSKKLKPTVWVLLSALVYVLNHIWRLHDGPAVLAYLFMFGLLLAYTVVLTKSLWLAFGIHWGANIGFELTRDLSQNLLVSEEISNWILAGVWGLLLVAFVLQNRIRPTLIPAAELN